MSAEASCKTYLQVQSEEARLADAEDTKGLERQAGSEPEGGKDAA